LQVVRRVGKNQVDGLFGESVQVLDAIALQDFVEGQVHGWFPMAGL
jgi:hypothetical protein